MATKTQQISRKNLHSIYNSVCEGWQKKIAEILVEQQINNEIDISEELLLKAYNEADNKQKKFLEKFFVINTPKKLLDGIKSFDDILKIGGETLENVIPYSHPKTKRQKRLNAVARIQFAEEILNEGWIPNWKDSSEYKYYPYFEYKVLGGWCFFFSYDCYFSISIAVPAYFKSKEISDFVGKLLIEDYKEFINR